MVISVVSQQKLTFEGRRFDEAYERGRPTIDHAHRRIFVGTSDHGMYALRADDGSSIWRFETMGAVQSEALYERGENVLYFGSNDGALYKVDADNGRLHWRFMTGAEVQRKPVLGNGLLYFANANDTVVALDPKTGEMKWNFHRSPVGGMSIAGYAGPAVRGNRVYFAFSDGNVMALDAMEGLPLWQPIDLAAEAEQAQGVEIPQYFDVDTTPVVDMISAGLTVFVGSYAGGMFALDALSGAQVWFNDRVLGATEVTMWRQASHVPRGGGPTIPARRLLLVSTGVSGFWALDPEDGTEQWRLPLPAGGISAPAELAGGLLFSTTRHGIFFVSPLNGKVIDGISMGMTFSMAPSAYGNRAYVLSDGGSWLSLHVAPPVVGDRN